MNIYTLIGSLMNAVVCFITLAIECERIVTVKLLLRKGAIAEGEIYDITSKPTGSGDTLYSPAVRFTDESGREHTEHSCQFTKGSEKYIPGQRVTIRYDRRDITKLVIVPHEPLKRNIALAAVYAVLLAVSAAIVISCMSRIS